MRAGLFDEHPPETLRGALGLGVSRGMAAFQLLFPALVWVRAVLTGRSYEAVLAERSELIAEPLTEVLLAGTAENELLASMVVSAVAGLVFWSLTTTARDSLHLMHRRLSE